MVPATKYGELAVTPTTHRAQMWWLAPFSFSLVSYYLGWWAAASICSICSCN